MTCARVSSQHHGVAFGTVDLDMPRQWTQDEDDRIVGEEPQGKGMVKVLDVSMGDKINKFCIFNS